MDMAQAILSCFCGLPGSTATDSSCSLVGEKMSVDTLLSQRCDPSKCVHERRAIDVVNILSCAEKSGESLKQQLDNTVGTLGWSQRLAEHILGTLVRAVKGGREKMGPALAKAYDNATTAADVELHKLVQDAKDHPLEIVAAVLLTALALGVLVAMAPYILEMLGFGELGPIEGKFLYTSALFALHVAK